LRTALVLIFSLACYVAVENLIFNTSWYPKIVNPDSSTGRVELFLWNEHKRPKTGPQVLTIGDSRMGFFTRYVNGDANIGYTFGTIAVAGSTPRDWYYMFRDADPTRRQYAAIVLPVEDYDDAETWENHTNRETDLHYMIARLRWSDIPEFAGSFQGATLKAAATLGVALKGSVYRADFQDLLTHRRQRLEFAHLARRESYGWYRDFLDTDDNVSGIQIDWTKHTLLIPPGHHEDEQRLFAEHLFSAEPPYTGRRSAYLSHWFNRIYDLYRGTGTRIIFFRLPRGPFPPPKQPPHNDHSSVRVLASKAGVILDDEHAFDALERPELFKDPLHFNATGSAEFSKMLGKHIRELLGPPAK